MRAGESTGRRGRLQAGKLLVIDSLQAVSFRGAKAVLSRAKEESAVSSVQFLVDVDLEGAQKLGVLVGETKLAFVIRLSVEFLAMHHVGLAALVEADRDFEDQEEVVARGADASHHFGNLLRLRQRVVDRVPEFVDELLESVVEFQGSPVRGDSLQRQSTTTRANRLGPPARSTGCTWA